jgi:hypothetical protein
MKHMDYIYFEEEDYYKNKKDMFSFVIDILKKHTKDSHKFQLSFDDKLKDDPARSWTAYVYGDKKFINGLGQVYNLICLEVCN